MRHEMARYMSEHSRGSLDSAIFHVLKIAYEQGVADAKGCDENVTEPTETL
jgi:hypothetical protein